jgi:hypothetical protein
MSCAKHVLNLRWEHHSWRRRVSSTQLVTTRGFDMWGRVVGYEHVLCQTHQVCTACGKIRDDGACLCGTAEGERCAIRLACLEARHGEAGQSGKVPAGTLVF